MEKHTEQIVNKQLKYYGFTLEYSKILSYFFLSVYGILFLSCWITDLFMIETNLHSLLNFVTNPTMTVVTFYFSKSFGEHIVKNVSETISDYMYKKLQIEKLKRNDNYSDFNGFDNFDDSEIIIPDVSEESGGEM